MTKLKTETEIKTQIQILKAVAESKLFEDCVEEKTNVTCMQMALEWVLGMYDAEHILEIV